MINRKNIFLSLLGLYLSPLVSSGGYDALLQNFRTEGRKLKNTSSPKKELIGLSPCSSDDDEYVVSTSKSVAESNEEDVSSKSKSISERADINEQIVCVSFTEAFQKFMSKEGRQENVIKYLKDNFRRYICCENQNKMVVFIDSKTLPKYALNNYRHAIDYYLEHLCDQYINVTIHDTGTRTRFIPGIDSFEKAGSMYAPNLDESLVSKIRAAGGKYIFLNEDLALATIVLALQDKVDFERDGKNNVNLKVNFLNVGIIEDKFELEEKNKRLQQAADNQDREDTINELIINDDGRLIINTEFISHDGNMFYLKQEKLGHMRPVGDKVQIEFENDHFYIDSKIGK